MLKPSCSNCSAWLRQRGEHGVCRALPPVPILTGMMEPEGNFALGRNLAPPPVVTSFFPNMMASGWCRVHEAIPAGEAN